jgi:hypothetical protein
MSASTPNEVTNVYRAIPQLLNQMLRCYFDCKLTVLSTAARNRPKSITNIKRVPLGLSVAEPG